MLVKFGWLAVIFFFVRYEILTEYLVFLWLITIRLAEFAVFVVSLCQIFSVQPKLLISTSLIFRNLSFSCLYRFNSSLTFRNKAHTFDLLFIKFSWSIHKLFCEKKSNLLNYTNAILITTYFIKNIPAWESIVSEVITFIPCMYVHYLFVCTVNFL